MRQGSGGCSALPGTSFPAALCGRQAAPFLSFGMRGGYAFTPSPRRRIASHACHSRLVMVTRLLALRHAVSLRSSTRTKPSASASRSAVLAVLRHTPASAAMCPSVRVQAPQRRTSAATTASTATSARVKRAASWGGIAPEAAQDRLRSMLAGDLGREPTRRCTGFCRGARQRPTTCPVPDHATCLKCYFCRSSSRVARPRTAMWRPPVRRATRGSLALRVGLVRCTPPQLGIDSGAFFDELFAMGAGSPSFVSQRVQPTFQRRC
jgi:hypothetical protein